MEMMTKIIKNIDSWVWGLPLILLILLCGIWLTFRIRGLQIRRIGLALKFMVTNEEEGEGEVTSFGALCTALSATIGTGNIVGVATAIAAGGPGALFWMEIAALFGMATKYAEGFLAIKYRTVDKEGHYLGGPFYYIENGMGSRWKWLAKLFALFGMLAGLLGIGTITQINGITSAANNFFDADSKHIAFTLFDTSYTWTTVITEELDKQIGAQLADKLRGELELIDGVYPEFDKEEYLKGELAPVFFGSALNNFGVQELLDCFVEIAPSPRPVQAEEREVEPEEPKFTGFVFKITANIDPNHRSCIAFCKICSGKFTRNAPYLHVRHGKTMRFSSPTQFMAQRKTTVDEAWAGDIIGLPDNGSFKIGDTLTEGEMLHFRGLPSFSPEMFKYIENADPMKQKQLAKGIDQLMDEGVAQLFVNQFNGRKIIGTVGQLQFEVIQYRLENEYSAKCRWEPLSLYKANGSI